ncbi:MAG: hypothetical protein K0B05_00945 [Bacteroidales bacterium]|nr:hypothetical protein [Bacteroidales bacterium]
MKKFILTSVLGVFLSAGFTAMGQRQPEEYLGLPGDNLNLYAVMKLFQESETLEAFERSLNDENSRINNLDLNRDNYVDYIKVVNFTGDNVHTIVLQAVLESNQSQDVAVFTVERLNDGEAQIQLIGDELLYGRNYIVEPIYAETPNPGYIGRGNRGNSVVTTTYVEVAAWPIVRVMYLPGYVGWRSSYYWGYYPPYWSTWSPVYWHHYYGYHYYWQPDYYVHYRRWHEPRFIRYHEVYYTRQRVFAPVVNNNINSGNYKTTYSRPESRRDGETLFAKTHPEEYRRSSAVAGTISERLPVSQSTPARQSSGTSTGTDRRLPAATTNRSATGSSADQNNSGELRSNEAATRRSAASRSAGQGSGSAQRSPAVSPSRSSTRTESGQRTSTDRTTRQSSRDVSSSSRRSSERSTATQKEPESSKSSESSNSRRK